MPKWRLDVRLCALATIYGVLRVNRSRATPPRQPVKFKLNLSHSYVQKNASKWLPQGLITNGCMNRLRGTATIMKILVKKPGVVCSSHILWHAVLLPLLIGNSGNVCCGIRVLLTCADHGNTLSMQTRASISVLVSVIFVSFSARKTHAGVVKEELFHFRKKYSIVTRK